MDASSPRKKLLIESQGVTRAIERMPFIIRDEVVKSMNDVEEQNSRELVNAIEAASDSIANTLKNILLTDSKEKIMTDNKNQTPTPQKPPAQQTPIPPTRPEPPPTRNIIEGQDPDYSAMGNN